MEVDQPPKTADLLRELSDLLREAKADDAKRMLVKYGQLLAARDDSGRGPAHLAAVGGCLPILQYAVGMDESAADEKDEMGWSPLMIATSAGRADVVRYLIALPQVNVNALNKTGQTALHYASSKNRAEIAHLLLEQGCEVGVADKYGATALHRAASQGHDKIVHMLLSQPRIHVDARDGEGNTPLFLACEENREDAAIALVLKGANPKSANKDEKCPLDVVQTTDLRVKLLNAEKRFAQ